jgi:DNA-binding NarL/FixJ family response regulator
VLAEMPRLMREIVEGAVRSQPDMQVVATVEADDTIADAVARASADVVILGLERGATIGAYDGLLYRHPRLHLVALTDDGRGALMCEMRPQRTAIADVSPSGIVDAIRASTRAGAK